MGKSLTILQQKTRQHSATTNDRWMGRRSTCPSPTETEIAVRPYLLLHYRPTTPTGFSAQTPRSTETRPFADGERRQKGTNPLATSPHLTSLIVNSLLTYRLFQIFSPDLRSRSIVCSQFTTRLASPAAASMSFRPFAPSQDVKTIWNTSLVEASSSRSR